MIGTSSDSKLGTSVRITSDGSTVIAANTPSSARPAEYLKSRGFTYIPLLANYVHSGLIDVDTGGVGGQIDLTPSGHRFVAFNGNAATELREAPVCSTAEGAGGTSGDPHLRLAHGGKADFRGKDGKYFAILSAPGLAFNLMTVDTTHMLTNRLTDWIPKTVYGSFFAAAAFVIRGNSGSVYAVEAVADEDWFTVSSNGNSTRYHSMWKQFKSDGILVLMKQVTLVVEARGWRIEVSKKAIFNKLDGPSKKRLDLVMFPLDDVSKSCFSHGIVGQATLPPPKPPLPRVSESRLTRVFGLHRRLIPIDLVSMAKRTTITDPTSRSTLQPRPRAPSRATGASTCWTTSARQSLSTRGST